MIQLVETGKIIEPALYLPVHFIRRTSFPHWTHHPWPFPCSSATVASRCNSRYDIHSDPGDDRNTFPDIFKSIHSPPPPRSLLYPVQGEGWEHTARSAESRLLEDGPRRNLWRSGSTIIDNEQLLSGPRVAPSLCGQQIDTPPGEKRFVPSTNWNYGIFNGTVPVSRSGFRYGPPHISAPPQTGLEVRFRCSPELEMT